MSHAATHWLATVPPEKMTHGEFRVLFHLCDCHNPSMGCFPKQTYLRDRTGLSNGGLNKALGELERKGLLRREQSRDERTNRQKPTHYILGFELVEAQAPPPLSGGGPGSTFTAVPSPLFGGAVSTGVESYTKEEPVKEPVKEPCASAQTTMDQRDFLDRFLAIYPRPGDREKTEDALKKALHEGANPDVILSGAKAYAHEQKGNQLRYIAYSENWVEQKRWTQYATASKQADAEVVRQQRAKAIREGKEWVGRHISAASARDLVAAKLVTIEQCRAAGVQL